MRRHKMNLSASAREAQIDRKHVCELIRKYASIRDTSSTVKPLPTTLATNEVGRPRE
ncbi:hypothetical protein BH11MYX2_BH11MYX2_22750 [soil metagenome]